MNYSIVIGSTSEDHEKKRRKDFCDTLSKMYNDFIRPKFGDLVKTLSIEMGLFTSDNYGSYRISFYNEEKKEVCYIIADTILGKWECFETKI